MRNIIFICCFLSFHLGFAQVGIGTTNPTLGYWLDVDGDLLIQSDFKVNAFLAEGIQSDKQFILRRINSIPAGEVVKMDMSSLDIAPINVVNYYFKNVNSDNLRSVNLQYDESKFVVGLSNVRYVGDPIQKGISGNNYLLIGNFVFRTFVENNKWHLEIRNQTRDALASSNIEYYVTLIVYDKKYFKVLPSISTNFQGNTSGSATIPTGL